jgi:MoaA/NifB/PqqE/SkfB family radical SAM enzyme
VNLRYNVEADWLLLKTCNFRCSYCFFPPITLGAKLAVHGSNSQWAEGFDATSKTWLLHITGGEPSIYPGFVELCELLTRNHYLSVNSNLSDRSIDDFAERIDPERVHFINAPVHLDERQKRSSVDVFIKRVHKLQRYRFNVLVSMIMTPEAIVTFPEDMKYFASHGLHIIPKVMRGEYQGNRYPSAYSDSQKNFITKCLGEAQRKYAPVLTSMREPPTINMFTDDDLLNNPPDYQGKVCGSGYNFVRIDPDGTVIRCGSEERLGNILLRNMRLLQSPKRCNTYYCPYFCKKYTSLSAETPSEGHPDTRAKPEDMFLAAKLIMKGYKIVYQSHAVIYHSHTIL